MKTFRDIMFQIQHDWTGHSRFYRHILFLVSNIVVDSLENDEKALKELRFWVIASKNTFDLDENEAINRWEQTLLAYDKIKYEQ